MRRIQGGYIHQRRDWPRFHWQQESLAKTLTTVRHKQGKLTGRMEALDFNLRNEASLQTLTLDVLKSSEIEGEVLSPVQVRSSIARRLGMDIAGLVPADRHVEGIVEMMLDATQHYQKELTADRLFAWHSAMFPASRSGMPGYVRASTGSQKIRVGAWRDNRKEDSMQVVSGPMGKERVHYEAPAAELLEKEMKAFLDWFNHTADLDPVLKAGVAHLWFVTIHPFDDGNGRIARAVADMQLARSDESKQRFYSMSAQIRKERNDYYDVLEATQKGTLDITAWLEWFFACLDRALTASDEILEGVTKKAKFWEAHSGTQFNARQQFMLNKLLDHFDGKLTSSKWAKMAKCSHDTALRDIQDLVSRHVLAKDPAGGRSTNYLLNNQR
jgi:Fic family protein